MSRYLTEEVREAVGFAANTVWKRYRRFVSREDLVQEGLIWVSTHPAKMREIFRDGEEWTERRAWGRLHKQLVGQMARVARTEKAHAEGYDPEDEAFYSPGTVGELLRAVWSGDAAYHGPESAPDHERVSGGVSDPAEGNSWIAMLADVRGAWDRADITGDDRTFLSLRIGSGMTFAEVGRAMGCSDEWARRRVQRCLSLLCDDLNGLRPMENEPDAEYKEASGE